MSASVTIYNIIRIIGAIMLFILGAVFARSLTSSKDKDIEEILKN